MKPFKEKEELLVDYLEGELDAASEKAIDYLLRHSDIDWRIVNNLEKTRDAIEVLSDNHVPESDEYYDQLHDKIMAKVDMHSQVGAKPGAKMAHLSRR